MQTKYTEKIIYYLEGDAPDEEMMEWVEQQPLIDQPDILREFKKLCQERFAKVGIFDFDFEDIDGYVQALNYLRNNPEKAQEMAQKSQKLLKTQHSWGEFIESVKKDIK